MAQGLGFTPAFIPPEPKNQRQARNRPDADLWEAAERKELETLWKMFTFELVNRPKDFDPLPLQFVYTLTLTLTLTLFLFQQPQTQGQGLRL